MEQKYRREKIPLCFESERSIILRHNCIARAYNERGLQIQCTRNNVRVTCRLSSEHMIIRTRKRVSASYPSWRSWSSSLIFWARLCQRPTENCLLISSAVKIRSIEKTLKFHPLGYHVMYVRKMQWKIGVTEHVFALHGWQLFFDQWGGIYLTLVSRKGHQNFYEKYLLD